MVAENAEYMFYFVVLEEIIDNLVSFSTVRFCRFFCTYENCLLNIYGFRFLVILELALTHVDLHDMEFMTFSG